MLEAFMSKIIQETLFTS